MKVMTPQEVSSLLGIQPSTLRKYSLQLESNGLVLERNANNSRKYTDTDVATLQRMQSLIQNDSMTVENAAYNAVELDNIETPITDKDVATRSGDSRYNDDDVTSLLLAEIKELKEEVQAQGRILDDFRTAQENRDMLFAQYVDELKNEITRLNDRVALPAPESEIASTIETEPEAEVAPAKKGFFSRLFK